MAPAAPRMAAQAVWQDLQRRAGEHGLNLHVVMTRETVEGIFAAAPPGAVTPATLHPGYRRVVLLGSAGPGFWERFQGQTSLAEKARPNPLDRFTETTVEGLLHPLRDQDGGACAAYPFRHPNQLVPFLALLSGSGLLRMVPFGVTVHPGFGPWFAWRCALVTALAFPAHPPPAETPCEACPAPCTKACPARAVHKGGFRWADCGAYRLAEATCRETCPARRACPVGKKWQYGAEQMAYHYQASLGELRRRRSREKAGT